MRLCVDASLALKWLTAEPGSQGAIAWLESHAQDELMAPTFFSVEVASVLRKKEGRNEISVEDGCEALSLLQRLNIRLIWNWQLAHRAHELAIELGQPTIYNTAYLALAESLGAELWTADASFAKRASSSYTMVRALSYA